MGLFFVFIQYF